MENLYQQLNCQYRGALCLWMIGVPGIVNVECHPRLEILPVTLNCP